MKKSHLSVKELPLSERPYEKFEKYGALFLTDAELLAIIIRTGTSELRASEVAANVLNYSKQNPGLIGLNYLTLNELKGIAGIGRVKAIQLLCIVELTKRMSKEKRRDTKRFMSPSHIAEYYMQDMRHLEFEQVMVLMLNGKNQLLDEYILSKGTVSASLAEPREVYLNALKCKAVNIILLHNHPSGDSTPSNADISLTYRIKTAGELLGINLLDHIIIGDNNYISFREKNIVFSEEDNT